MAGDDFNLAMRQSRNASSVQCSDVTTVTAVHSQLIIIVVAPDGRSHRFTPGRHGSLIFAPDHWMDVRMSSHTTTPPTSGLNWLREPRSRLGEAPLWNPQTRRLGWVDCEQKLFFNLDPLSGHVVTNQLPSAPGSYAFRKSGGMIMAYRNKLVLLDPQGEIEREIETPLLDFTVERFNDGKCDRKGRFWLGSMDPKMSRPTGSLFCVDPDLTIRRMQSDVTVSNGMAFSPDDSVLYHTDSKADTIYAYDFDIATGAIANRRIFADFKSLGGRPDGCTIDAEGHLWAAVLGTGSIVRFTMDGRESGRIVLPTKRPTSVMFGDDNLKTLYITTMQAGLSAEELTEQPSSGCLFWRSGDIQGLPEPFFDG
jgi:L-arabinonolactonase